MDAIHKQPIPLLGDAALCEIARNFSKAQQFSTFISNASDDDISPKTASILANAPTFVFETPYPGSNFQLVVWFVARNLFFRVENGKVPANDFFGCILLKPLSPGVPGCHYAAWVKKEDGVVAYRVHHNAENTLVLEIGTERISSGRDASSHYLLEG